MRRLYFIIIGIVTVCAMVGCGKDKVSADELALQAAKVYYEQLLQGNYAAFVAGTYGYDSVPDDFREQLEVNAKQFVYQQKSERNGIDSIRALHAKVDTLKMEDGTQMVVAKTFLQLCFGDSTKEEVVVPMVERNGVWMMK